MDGHCAPGSCGQRTFSDWCIDAPSQIRLFVVSGVRLVREGLARSVQTRRRMTSPSSAAPASPKPRQPASPTCGPMSSSWISANHEGIAAAQTLRVALPDLEAGRVLGCRHGGDVFACAAAGFSGYVTREASVDDLLLRRARRARRPDDLLAAHRRGPVQPARHRLNPPKPTNGASLLTARERQILTLSDEGWSNKEIGRRLQISPSTVKNHIHSILQKLQVERRGQAAARCAAPTA